LSNEALVHRKSRRWAACFLTNALRDWLKLRISFRQTFLVFDVDLLVGCSEGRPMDKVEFRGALTVVVYKR